MMMMMHSHDDGDKEVRKDRYNGDDDGDHSNDYYNDDEAEKSRKG